MFTFHLYDLLLIALCTRKFDQLFSKGLSLICLGARKTLTLHTGAVSCYLGTQTLH